MCFAKPLRLVLRMLPEDLFGLQMLSYELKIHLTPMIIQTINQILNGRSSETSHS
ncbi:MAG: hypothetical protein CM1200mP28_14560 [Deltaproteobacteria bacterium]|nr:MAG: hypothetical protein CM1200mP28_14560 [Deltaproteobacteria bacterium]